MLQAVADDFRHRAERRPAVGHAMLQELHDVLCISLRPQGRRVPIEHRDQAAPDVLLPHAAPRAALRMAGGAMTQALDEVRAAVPLGALLRVGLEYPLP